MPMRESNGGGVYIDPGQYRARFIRLEDKPGGKFGDQVVWHLNLTDQDGYVIQDDRGNPLDWWVWTGESYQTPKSKAYPMVAAFTGRDPATIPAKDMEDALFDKECTVFIGDEQIPGTTDVRSKAMSWSVLKPREAPAGRPAARRAAPAEAPAAAEEPPF